jgi:hypothetical protein
MSTIDFPDFLGDRRHGCGAPCAFAGLESAQGINGGAWSLLSMVIMARMGSKAARFGRIGQGARKRCIDSRLLHFVFITI